MTAIDPADALQAGIYATLSADTELMGLVTGIYDGPPEDATLNYITLGEMTSTPDGTHDGEGRQTVAMIHSWARAEGMASVNAIGARIVALLWHRHAELQAHVTGHTVWRVEHEFGQALVDPQPGIRHRVDRFRIWSSEV